MLEPSALGELPMVLVDEIEAFALLDACVLCCSKEVSTGIATSRHREAHCSYFYHGFIGKYTRCPLLIPHPATSLS